MMSIAASLLLYALACLLPSCWAYPTAKTKADLNMRQAASTTSTVLYMAPLGATLELQCYVIGESVSGNTQWVYSRVPTKAWAFASDKYLDCGGSYCSVAKSLPKCGSTTPPPATTTCSALGVSGTCVPTASCPSDSISTCGNCPGDSTSRCCVKPTACSSLGTESSGEAWENGVKIGTVTLVQINSKPVEKTTACAFTKMRSAAASAGVTLSVTSGFRTYTEQEYLYNCYLCKCCNNGNLAAKPGYSNHQNGMALDITISSSAVYTWLYNNAAKYGFVRTVSSENWHWEYRPTLCKFHYFTF